MQTGRRPRQKEEDDRRTGGSNVTINDIVRTLNKENAVFPVKSFWVEVRRAKYLCSLLQPTGKQLSSKPHHYTSQPQKMLQIKFGIKNLCSDG